MQFFLVWADQDSIFTSATSLENTEPVFHMDIQENEGRFPVAYIVIRNPGQGLLCNTRQSHAFILTRIDNHLPQLLFAGKVVGVPVQIEGNMLKIMLLAQPSDAQEQLENLCGYLKVAPYWDELFVSPSHHSDISEALDARSALPYWSRFAEPLRLTSLFQGSARYNLESRFFRERLDFRLIHAPLTSIQIKLKAEWIQQYRGYTNVSFFLRSKFPGGLVNTFTGQDLENKWWKAGETIGHSGYWIEASHLKEIAAPSTGVLNLYPKSSQKFMLSPLDPLNTARKPFLITLKRSWYRAKLVLGWMYRQKRVENLYFTLEHKYQPIRNNSIKSRAIKINLQMLAPEKNISNRIWRPYTFYKKGDLINHAGEKLIAGKQHISARKFHENAGLWEKCKREEPKGINPCQASFFTTPRGHQAIEHALEIARTHLAASARAIEISLQAPFEEIMYLTCDHSVHIADERLPGGQAWGKVKSTRLVVEGESGRLWGELCLGVSIGTGEHERLDNTPRQTGEATGYCQNDYCQDLVFEVPGTVHQTPSLIRYQGCESQLPREGILYPDQMSAGDLVEGLEIINGPEAQEVALSREQYPYRHSLKATLKENKTDIILRLRDLGPEPRLVHNIHLKILDPWSAPQQIDLAASGKNPL